MSEEVGSETGVLSSKQSTESLRYSVQEDTVCVPKEALSLREVITMPHPLMYWPLTGKPPATTGS